ncbi:MAG TPA: DegQ family serine endoprotease [Candidatus Polarisedimenticolia bacterium]|nr:DegQ family serine endoprotease [Candidatus Polarisedimenticolia bacterium]
MNRFSKRMSSFWMAVIGGAAVLTVVPGTSFGRETNALPQIKTDDTPIQREAHGLNSYAPIIKNVEPSVVNIYSTRMVRERETNPFFNDPFFRHFFGPNGGGGDNNDNNNDDQGGGGSGSRNRHRQHSERSQSLGSGVIISSDGYILTANHVVEGADEIKVALANGGPEFTAKVIGADAPTDVAVLKISGKNLPPVTIADSDKLEVGDVVLAIGNPFGVGQTVTMGIVSGVGRTSLGINQYEDFIQTDAAINPGNSGGALVDAEGRLVGINTAIFSESGGYQGVGFAVPVNLARSVMDRLIKYGKVTRGYLGVDIQSLTPDLAEEFNLPDKSGALVTDVEPNTPAAKAGLQNGDVIREVEGKKIADSQQLRLMISQSAPGTKVTVKFLRTENDKKPEEKTVTATLGTLPGQAAMRGQNAPEENKNSNYDSLDGVEVADIDSGARQQYSIPSSVRGAVVTSVDEDSNSADAGLHEGDVIQEINHEPVKSADDAVRLSEKAHGSRVLLRVYRQNDDHGGSFYITVDNTKRK